jgi:hypothetical protein
MPPASPGCALPQGDIWPAVPVHLPEAAFPTKSAIASRRAAADRTATADLVRTRANVAQKENLGPVSFSTRVVILNRGF